jgi:hypothetical protein
MSHQTPASFGEFRESAVFGSGLESDFLFAILSRQFRYAFRQKENPQMKRIFAASLLVAASSFIAFGQTQSRAEVLNEMETKRAELAKLETQFLSTSAEDRAAYAEFLAQPNTGLIRLLPREKFDSDANKNAAMTIRGGGAYYSFSRLTHEYGQGSDLELSSGYLSVGFAGADYGMLIKLDGARLEDISGELPGVAFLAKYGAVTNEPDARVEQRRFGTGTVIEGVTYKERVPVEVGATYVLRSINFERSDMLVAFRVVRQDTDGSLIIAWRMLEKYPTPKLARNIAAN